VNPPPSLVGRQEFGAVDFPRCTMGLRIGRRVTCKGEDPFAAAAIVDPTDLGQVTGLHARFLPRLAPRRMLQGFAFIGDPFRNTPRRPSVVRSGRMDQQHLKDAVPEPVQQRASRMDHDVRTRECIGMKPGFTVNLVPAASMGQTGCL
jgi:hypothetical protein